MPRLSVEQQLANVEAKRKTLMARLSKQERAKDTRRKILVGALVLHRLEQPGDAEFASRLNAWLRRELPGFLSRDEDKALFDGVLKLDRPSNLPTSAASGSTATSPADPAPARDHAS